MIIGSKQLKTGLNLLQRCENAKSSLENMIPNKTNIKISLLSNERYWIYFFIFTFDRAAQIATNERFKYEYSAIKGKDI